jgi:predicted O-methyltransferase YrrM
VELGQSTLRRYCKDQTVRPEEPITAEAVASWIAENMRSRDRFAPVYDASEAHRAEHGNECDVYPSSNGPLLGALAGVAGAKRLLEIGCGLGYSALWLAHGSRPDGIVETCEKSALHAGLASEQFRANDAGSRVKIHRGRSADVLAQLSGVFDFIFCDGDPDQYLTDLGHFLRLLRPGGTLVSSNLFLGIHVPDAPWLRQSAEYRLRILDDPQLDTVFLPRGLALSVKVR